MEILREFLPFLIPILVIQIGLMVISWVHIFKNPNFRFGNRTTWLLIVTFTGIIGPIIYFSIGRVEK